jgi:hypothetical protein
VYKCNIEEYLLKQNYQLTAWETLDGMVSAGIFAGMNELSAGIS